CKAQDRAVKLGSRVTAALAGGDQPRPLANTLVSSQASNLTSGSCDAASSSSRGTRYLAWLASDVCELIRQTRASRNVGPSPLRARATARPGSAPPRLQAGNQSSSAFARHIQRWS